MTSSVYFAARFDFSIAYAPLLEIFDSIYNRTSPFSSIFCQIFPGVNVNADLFQSILEAVFIPLFGLALGPLSCFSSPKRACFGIRASSRRIK